MQVKLKTKFNIGDKVICMYGASSIKINTITSIDIAVYNNQTIIHYYLDDNRLAYEKDCMSIEEFNELQKSKGRSYQDYIDWLNRGEK